MRVAVLGCGPAGLMAAHAAKLSGAKEVDVYSRRRKSELYGAQYLHSPIPGMTDSAPVTVRYSLEGTVAGYRTKVYGEAWDGFTSPEEHEGDHDAWDIRQTYSNLWTAYGGYVFGTEISGKWLRNFMDIDGRNRYDYVVSSVPKPLLCMKKGQHRFDGQQVSALGDAPERGIFVDDHIGRDVPNNTVICSGLVQDDWYRVSRVFGYATVEWPEGTPRFLLTDASQLVKPLQNDCDCWANVIHVGRFGRWEKGVLADSAFQDVMSILVGEPIS